MRYTSSLSFLSILFSLFSWPMLAQAQSLPAVSGVAYDGQQITWDNLEGASGYNIHLDVDYLTTVGDVDSYTPTGTGRYYVVGYNDAGSYSPLEVITNDIVPVKNFVDVGIDVDDAMSGGVTGSASTGVSSSVGVTNANYDGTNITWDALPDANGYNVHYFFQGAGGWTYLTTVGAVLSYTPEMTGSYNIVGYDDAGNYSAFQMIDGGRTVSTNSARVETIGVEPNTPTETPAQGLPAVSGVAYDGNTITWDPIEGATGYNVHIDNFAYLATLGDVTSYTPEFSAKYYIVAYDYQGNYSPIQIIEADVVPTSNSVEVN